MSQELERVYTINLGKVLLSPDNQRAKRAINMIKEFARHHMKIEDIKIEEELSHKIWSRGIRSPPRKIRVRMTKTDEGFVLVTLYEEEIEKISDKKKEKLDEKISEETKVDEVKEEAKPKKEEAKPKKEEAKPKKEEAKPKKEEAKPKKEEAKPKKEEAKPKKEEAKPKKEEAKPKKEEAKPKKEEAKPKKETKKESKPKKSTK